MERNEANVQNIYAQLRELLPEAEVDEIIRQEEDHEKTLLDMLDEDRIRYAGSIVLGLNDALVELTGALAGLTFALQNTRLVALTGMITGIAAALSMGASEYLATKSEETIKNPFRASIYTGVTYLVTVLILIFPYLVFTNYYLCLVCTLAAAILIIAFFNYYISVAKGESFTNRFIEMAGLSLGVAAFSFLIGVILRTVLNVEL
jgi:VIT1/CCC1 family predicted Fe2+/Mn2+ transporter